LLDRSEANSLPVLFSTTTQTTDPSNVVSNTQRDLKPLGPNNPPLPAGFYEDEAYIAPVEDLKEEKAANSPSNLDELYSDAQRSYNNLLRHRFILLRSTLRCSPPAGAIDTLDNDHPISLPRKAGSAHKTWRRLLVTVEPRMVQLASMDMESVLEVLEILARMMSDVVRGDDIQRVRRIGAWAWGLLGKCREVGQLSTREVGVVRSLGKRAATILRKVQELEYDDYEEDVDYTVTDTPKGETKQVNIVEDEKDTKEEAQQSPTVHNEEATRQGTQPEPTAQGEEEAQLEPTVRSEEESKQEELPEAAEAQGSSMADASLEESDLEAAKARLQARLQNNSDSVEAPAGCDDIEEDDWSIQTHALLDMIITVVGEFFGQRDLLKEREIWD
jgi:regulator of vacuolar morphogenesis